MFSIFAKFLKFSFLLLVLSYVLTGLSFVLYHIYYGGAIALSFIVPYSILNLMMYSIIGLLLYTAYIFLYE